MLCSIYDGVHVHKPRWKCLKTTRQLSEDHYETNIGTPDHTGHYSWLQPLKPPQLLPGFPLLKLVLVALINPCDPAGPSRTQQVWTLCSGSCSSGSCPLSPGSWTALPLLTPAEDYLRTIWGLSEDYSKVKRNKYLPHCHTNQENRRENQRKDCLKLIITWSEVSKLVHIQWIS